MHQPWQSAVSPLGGGSQEAVKSQVFGRHAGRQLTAMALVDGGGGSPGGSDTQVQYNSSGSFAGSAKFTYSDSSSPRLSIEANGTSWSWHSNLAGSVYLAHGYDSGGTALGLGVGNVVASEGAELHVGTSSGHALRFYTSGNEVFSINGQAFTLPNDAYLELNPPTTASYMLMCRDATGSTSGFGAPCYALSSNGSGGITGDLAIGPYSNHYLRFFTNGLERWDIDTSGNLIATGRSSTTKGRLVAEASPSWADSTDASRKGRIALGAHDAFTSAGSPREGVRVESSGSAAMLGFYGTAAVVQYSTTGTTAGFTAGAGAAVDSAATFTGNTGSTAYTISDIVKALKLLGLIAT